jgi:serine/threonine protein kinase
VVLKLADVGDAKVLVDSHHTRTGTPLFRAPEIMSQVYTTSVDVFSAGMSMAETVLRCIADDTGVLALSTSTYVDRQADMVNDAAGLVHGRCPELSTLLRQCCATDASKRPDAATAARRVAAVRALQHMREMVADGGWYGDVDEPDDSRGELRMSEETAILLWRRMMVSLLVLPRRCRVSQFGSVHVVLLLLWRCAGSHRRSSESENGVR